MRDFDQPPLSVTNRRRPEVKTTDWVRIYAPVPRPTYRLVCFSHAGAGASIYRQWAFALAARGIELAAVQLPGREDRTGETPITSFPDLVRSVADAWQEISARKPSAVFGHSLGAAVAFETIRELIRRGEEKPPFHLCVSGRNAPHVPNLRPKIGHLEEEDFVRELLAQFPGGLPPEVLDDPELRSLVVQVLRADFSAGESYELRDLPPLDIALSAFGGCDDPWTSPAELAEWQRYSRQTCSVSMFPGGHFFHVDSWSDVMNATVRSHSRWVGQAN
jgi:medium-chain acyl-[acyl-carrier-protein] hydrolase